MMMHDNDDDDADDDDDDDPRTPGCCLPLPDCLRARYRSNDWPTHQVLLASLRVLGGRDDAAQADAREQAGELGPRHPTSQ